ncbi:MAG: ABC transporter substrate-binding protein [Chitinophagaceae bacterium]|nr:ABC transporter substrate-binding protein [Chitinophagaceae bacterium]
MNKTGIFVIALLILFFKTSVAQIQQETPPRIALFVPLYLDSVFDASGKYKAGKTIPKYISSALDFYQGSNFALDSLDKEKIKMNVQVYDVKNPQQSVYKIADAGGLDSVSLIIGAVNGKEYLDLAAVAKEKKIPFVSASYPNDGGISANPYVVIVNPKLNTHLQVIYNYILKNFGTNKLVMLRRQNGADDRITEVFKSLNASGSGTVLNIQTTTLNNVFTAKDIAASLDSTRENVIICGSLDDNFAKNIISYASTLSPNYKITLVGMPTWQDYPELSRPEIKNLPVIYSASFFNPGEEVSWVENFTQRYGRNTYTKPNEMAFRGLEIMYLFSHLLQKDKANIISNLNDDKHLLLTDFEFKPIYKNKSSTTPDYYENKRVFILKQWNDELTKEN